MKKLFPIVLTSVLLVSVFLPNAYGQTEVEQLLTGNVNDASVLAKAYLDPLAESFGTSLNNGWYNSAKPHKLVGFDITFTIPVTLTPSSTRKFDVSKMNLEYWELKDNSQYMSPTVTGEKSGGISLVDKATGSNELQLPQGANLQFVPAPIVQVGVGLPFHTEIIGRFFPKVEVSDIGNFSMWGIGIKNEFKEFIPVFKALPFSMSVLLGYSNFSSSFDINSSQHKELTFKANGFTGKLLISKSIPVLTVYAGVGFNKSKTNVDVKGTYDFSGVSVTDPISLEFKNNGVNANIGLRIKLAVLAFHFDYAFGKYSVANAGVGINFR
ncbi:MAG TPA: hypothetical protein P5349_05185 [Tenuifilaceae bacterium]|nr:hypothetical protein [Tenuifilaceae bacterium]